MHIHMYVIFTKYPSQNVNSIIILLSDSTLFLKANFALMKIASSWSDLRWLHAGRAVTLGGWPSRILGLGGWGGGDGVPSWIIHAKSAFHTNGHLEQQKLPCIQADATFTVWSITSNKVRNVIMGLRRFSGWHLQQPIVATWANVEQRNVAEKLNIVWGQFVEHYSCWINTWHNNPKEHN